MPPSLLISAAAATVPPSLAANHIVNNASSNGQVAYLASLAATETVVANSSKPKPSGIPKKAIIKKAVPRVPHVKRSIGKVTVADHSRGVTPRTYSKGDLGTLVMAFSEKVAPGEVVFERNVFPSRPTMLRMSYIDPNGKKKLHKSLTDLLDWLHAKQSLDFFVEMRTKCMDYLSSSDLAALGMPPMQQPSTPINLSVGATVASASPHGDEAEVLLRSDSEEEEEEDDVVDDDDELSEGE